MNDSNELPDMPAEIQADVEDVCEAFESAWQRGEEPKLAPAMDGFERPERRLLLRELIAIERYYHSRHLGREVSNAELLDKHPAIHDELLNELSNDRGGETQVEAETYSIAKAIASPTAVDEASRVHFDEFPVEFGRYRLLRRLGTGGMGSVYLAEDTQLERRVALKLPQLGGQSEPQMVSRFYREAKAAATLSHANLCAVYDAGDIDGVHFLTMEYIEGESLAERLKSGERFSDRDAVRLIQKIAQALHQAHQKGVVHRDLKPANIMIDAAGEPTITDFGLAQRTEEDATQLTQHGQILGTPAYMSPEQVDGDLEKIGPASDVYALGVVLFELLTGQRPFQGSTAAVFGQIITADPPPMIDYRDSVAPELEALCRRMMVRPLENRYESMEAVAEAAGKWLQAVDHPTAARPHRSRLGLLATAFTLVALLLAAVYVIRVQTREGEVVVESAVPGITVDIKRDGKMVRSGWQLSQGRNNSTVRTGRVEVTLPKHLQGQYQIEQDHVTLTNDGKIVAKITRKPAPLNVDRDRAAVAKKSANTADDSSVKPDAVPRTPLPDGPPGEVGKLRGHLGLVREVAFSPDGRFVASASWDQTIRVWDVERKVEVHHFDLTNGATCVAFSADGKFIAGGQGNVITIWDAQTGRPVQSLKEHSDAVMTIAFSPTGNELASGGKDGNVYIWDLPTGKPKIRWPKRLNSYIAQVAFSRNGRRLFFGAPKTPESDKPQLALWDTHSQKEIWTINPAMQLECFQLSPDETVIAYAGFSRLYVLNLPDTFGVPQPGAFDRVGKFNITLELRSLAFCPDGRHVVCGGGDKAIRIVDIVERKEVFRFDADAHVTAHVAVSPDGRFLISGGDRYHELDPVNGSFIGFGDDGDYSLRLWRLPKFDES